MMYHHCSSLSSSLWEQRPHTGGCQKLDEAPTKWRLGARGRKGERKRQFAWICIVAWGKEYFASLSSWWHTKLNYTSKWRLICHFIYTQDILPYRNTHLKLWGEYHKRAVTTNQTGPYSQAFAQLLNRGRPGKLIMCRMVVRWTSTGLAHFSNQVLFKKCEVRTDN